jgi:2-polyprenyl-3-methyl-5-hydroxy-6-metoxy-1,4-benzoquinol methylase
MTTTTSRMGNLYNEKSAASELRKYRQKGPIPSTRALIEALKAAGVEGATLLDIGGGIGAIQHELLDAGLARATSVDASRPYLDASRKESDRRGYGGRVTYRHGDFVELAESVPAADIVTLDRVLNVYPDWERLTELSAQHAQRLYGLVYPRNTLMVRLVTFAMNVVLRLFRKPVRASVRPGEAIDLFARQRGLVRHFSQSVGPAWQVAVYRRPRP